MIITEEQYLAHYGTLRRSGRYPWGSGGSDAEHNRNFLELAAQLHKEGKTDTEIAKYFGLTTTQLRASKSIAKNSEKQIQINLAQDLHDKGNSNVAIGKRMGLPESSVRALLAPGTKDKNDILQATSNMLKDQVDQKRFVDVGVGVEHYLSISDTKLRTALAQLQEEGYEVHPIQVDQIGTNNKTIVKVLAPPGTTYRDIVTNKDKIQSLTDYSTDGGRTYVGTQKPLNVDLKRVAVRYAEEGGAQSDGVIYVRPGVSDLSLGAARYAQVRIAVGGTHYLKGMAMYKDDLPAGVDLMFNTNKSNTGNKLDAMKPQKLDDPTNPFGASVKQKTDPETGKVISAMNTVNEEGDWQKWSNNLSSQMLSKQSPSLAKTQLNMTYEQSKNDLDEIMKLTNPAVRKKLLEGYADAADSSAVHLEAAALPRQGPHVILPIESMKDTEIYAPNFNSGERVALIRYPHGGTFEIPELTVNNRQPEAKKLLGDAKDAVGINSKVAERLSGADFDGDNVWVIPNNSGKVKTSPALAGLKNFDPKSAYPKYEGMPVMTPRQKGFAMGDISNLITDMTIQGAPTAELARAVRHSMVVIDAEKHELNWKQSAIKNGIPALKVRYQGKANAGASTLISKATARIDVPKFKPRAISKGGPVDKQTGEKIFEKTGESFVDKNGKTVINTTRSKKLVETNDAHTLSSGTPIEKVYADHSNALKALANTARKEAVNTKNAEWSDSAKKVYSKEVTSLNAKLALAQRNAPLERAAQVLANALVAQKRAAKPGMDAAELKKIKFQALTESRIRTDAKKQRIKITDDEWAAIQAGAISSNKLNQIINNSDLDRLKELAMPKTAVLMTSAKTARAKQMVALGYPQAEIASALGVGLTTLKKTLSEGG